MDNTYLCHYGVKGMKWRVHKYKTQTDSQSVESLSAGGEPNEEKEYTVDNLINAKFMLRRQTMYAGMAWLHERLRNGQTHLGSPRKIRNLGGLIDKGARYSSLVKKATSQIHEKEAYRRPTATEGASYRIYDTNEARKKKK